MQYIPLPGICWFPYACWIVYMKGCIFPDIELLLLEFLQGKFSPGKLYDIDIWF